VETPVGYTLSPQQTIAHYRITSKLGEGGMGEVWRATDTKLGRDVAIKVLPGAFANDPDRMARFTREAQVLASLNHPNIATIYGVEDRALIMEVVDGPTLAERIAQEPISIAEALPIAKQIAEALEYAHERGIIHRDLKPANIKLTIDGRVKLLDFGLAKALANNPVAADPASSPTLTMRATVAGTIIGTAAYMAPEQAKGKPADRRADIWAFGCVLFEMLAGKPAFAGETVSDILAAVIKERPDLGAAPPHLRAVIERCLRQDARTRWQAIGDVRVALEEAKPEPVKTELAPARRGMLPWVMAALAIAIAAGVLAIYFRERMPVPEIVRFQLEPPRNAAFGTAFALSPDGRKLAFAAAGPDGRSMLWIRPLDAVEAKPLPGTEGTVFLPFWSPDSRFVAFSVDGKLKKIDAEGGPPQGMSDVPQIVIGGSWSRAGVILFGSNAGPLLKVPAAGGVATPMTRIEREETFHSHPFFLPDGRHFLYTRHSGNPGATGIYVGSLDDRPEQPRPRRLLSAQFAVYSPGARAGRGHLLFLRDRSLMAQPFDAQRLELEGEAVPLADPVAQYITRGLFSVSATGTLAYQTGLTMGNRLVWYDRHGGVLSDAEAAGAYNDPQISPDGTRLAVRQIEPQTDGADIWVMDLARGGGSRFTFNPAADTRPVWSPDGSQIVFTSSRSGMSDLYRKSSSGAGTAQLLHHSSDADYPYDWSPDGRFLIFGDVSPQTGLDLWLLPQPGDASPGKPIPFLVTEFREAGAQFSPDGHWIAYVSNASGRPEVYVRPFPPRPDSGQWPVSTSGGVQPRWNRNGKELLYFSGAKLMSVEVKTTPSFQAGEPKALFEAPIFTAGDVMTEIAWDISRDGKRFLITTHSGQTGAAPITIVLNWAAGLALNAGR
ncbi:MAG: serine/threonine-protein kinase, partial [Acidobacteriota bacterium]|nr:serine/threonine-protein kinase [Acidobacteriota bacterium]